MDNETNIGPGVHKALHLIIKEICKEVNLSYVIVEEIVCSWDSKKDSKLEQTCSRCGNRVETL